MMRVWGYLQSRHSGNLNLNSDLQLSLFTSSPFSLFPLYPPSLSFLSFNSPNLNLNSSQHPKMRFTALTLLFATAALVSAQNQSGVDQPLTTNNAQSACE